MRKAEDSFWEKLFVYPSFSLRFWFVVVCIALFFIGGGLLILFKLEIVHTISDKIAFVNLLTQIAILIFGIGGAYYALRQLVENRFNNLDEAGMLALKNKHYFRAAQKWKEAFYIRPESLIFLNLAEALLLLGDHVAFDRHIETLQKAGILKQHEMFQEASDRIILLYLQSIRHLLVKNQGEAERYISKLVILCLEENGLMGFQWDFSDFKMSASYQELTGECKIIADNLILYLTKNISSKKRQEFESGQFATQQTE